MTKQIISKDKLLESGIHFGHQTKSWNPAMKPFIAMSKRGIHLINLDKSSQSLENAYNIAKKISERRGVFLFVGTTKQSSKTVKDNAERVGAFYIDHRWLGGILTNFKTIQNSINKLRKLERLDKTGYEGYTKKESILMKKDLDKLEKALGGIKYMRRLPQAIFVTSIRNEDIAIKEAKKMRIPVFGISDTNVDPYTVNFPIFGNDDGNKSAALITTVIADAIAAAKNEKQLAAYVDDEKIELMGIIPQEEKEARTFKKDFKHRDSKPFEKREWVSDYKKPKLVEETKTPIVKEETKTTPIKEVVKEKVSSAKTTPTTKTSSVSKTIITKTSTEEAKISKLSETEVKNKIKKEKMRKKLLEKISKQETKDFSKIELNELYGIDSKIMEYLKSLMIDNIEKISNIKITKELVEGLPGAKTLDKTKKIKEIIKEAKFIISK